MNQTCLLFLLIIFSLPAFGQREGAGNPRDPRGRDKIRAAHAAYITERLELTPEEAEKFWPVYREFGEKRHALRQQFRDTRKAETDEKTLLDLDLKIKQQELDLEKEYSLRFQEILPPEKLLKLQQAETDFRKLVFRQIQQRHRRN